MPTVTEPDWADRLAEKIFNDFARAPRMSDALPLIASRLRLVFVEGERAGIAQALKAAS